MTQLHCHDRHHDSSGHHKWPKNGQWPNSKFLPLLSQIEYFSHFLTYEIIQAIKTNHPTPHGWFVFQDGLNSAYGMCISLNKLAFHFTVTVSWTPCVKPRTLSWRPIPHFHFLRHDHSLAFPCPATVWLSWNTHLRCDSNSHSCSSNNQDCD